jgi:hypothetical protein
VETMVAMEFAESLNPFRKSNVKARMIRKTIVKVIGYACLTRIDSTKCATSSQMSRTVSANW